MKKTGKARCFLLVLTLLAWAGGTSEVAAVTLYDLYAGDILVTDAPLGYTMPGIIRANDPSGLPKLVSSGPAFRDPHGMTIDATGRILVADQLGGGVLGGGVILANPTPVGPPTLLYSGGAFVTPWDVAVDSIGRILVADWSARGIIQANHSSGTPTLVYSGVPFVSPWGITVDATGKILVADPGADPDGAGPIPPGGVIWANPPAEELTCPGSVPCLLHSGGDFVTPFDVAVGAAGKIFVSDYGATDPTHRGVIWANAPGAPDLVYFGSPFVTPQGIVVDATGRILVADDDAGGGLGGVIWANPSPPAPPTLLYSGGDFSVPVGIAVVSLSTTVMVVPEPGTLLLLGAGLSGLVALAWLRRRPAI